ncbi:PIG-L deacetylase family protein [Effusibacillus dendaii]|uniref:PIG-L family deacetylase n=1 Tax=Effusibacillus dendaii TaxID=2743772 RepID=A0A7I8DAH4_9BACL|nr:PIG-L family deacetylase [Effusibacillus dendaii]BCJ87104.1 hypothetical protein skT53_20890 [Effusibacillus dendaii]
MFQIRKKTVWVALLAVVLILGLVLYRPFLADFLVANRAMNNQLVQFGNRILFVAPHPDDETLGGAALIQKALAQKKQVKVVIMTCGDGYERAVIENFGVVSPKPADYQRLGKARRAESIAALNRLGVKQSDILFLGYPDGGTNGLWEENWDRDHLHRGRNGSDRSPYDFSYEKGAPYAGENVVKNLSSIIDQFHPTDIVYPDPHDQHHDHWATQAFVSYTLAQRKEPINEWFYLVHHGGFPAPWLYEPNRTLDPPYAFQHLDTSWHTLPMNQQEETTKHDAVNRYATQMKVMEPFLLAFIRKNDLLATYQPPVLGKVQGTGNVQESVEKSNPLFPDAVDDTLSREFLPTADLTAVSGIASDDAFWVGVKSRSGSEGRITYHVRIRFFRPEGVNRLDLTVQDSRLSAEKLAKNSMDLPAGARLQKGSDGFWVVLPKSVLQGATRMMMSADSYLGDQMIDKTAWRLVQANQSANEQS